MLFSVFEMVKGLLLQQPLIKVNTTTITGTGKDVSKFDGIGVSNLFLGLSSGTFSVILNLQESATLNGTYVTFATLSVNHTGSDFGSVASTSFAMQPRKKFVRSQLLFTGTVSTFLSVDLQLTRKDTSPIQ